MPYKPSTRLNQAIATHLIKNVDNFLFDCDGVVWNWPNAIPGSVEFINKLKQLGKKCYFITNNNSKTREMVLNNVKNIGILNVTEDDIVCTAWLLASYLKSINFTEKVFVVGNPAMGVELDKQGIQHFGIGSNNHKIADPSSFNYVKELKLEENVKCVAVGFDHHFNYSKMVEATSYAYRNEECLFIATNDDATFPVGGQSKIIIPGTGVFVNALKHSIGRDPIILGKPHLSMWQVLSKLHNLDPNRSCMIGDNLKTDIAFAANCSLGHSLAVLSGVTNEQEIEKYSKLVESDNNNSSPLSKMCPDYYTNCLGDFEQLIRDA